MLQGPGTVATKEILIWIMIFMQKIIFFINFGLMKRYNKLKHTLLMTISIWSIFADFYDSENPQRNKENGQNFETCKDKQKNNTIFTNGTLKV